MEVLIKEAKANDEVPLGPLNALREPEAYRTLWAKPIDRKLLVQGIKLAELLREVSGLPVVASRLADELRVYEVLNVPRMSNALMFAEDAVRPGLEFRLDHDRIEIFSRAEALWYWEQWWRKEKPVGAPQDLDQQGIIAWHIDSLRFGSVRERALARQELQKLGKDAKPALKELLESDDSEVRAQATYLLDRLEKLPRR